MDTPSPGVRSPQARGFPEAVGRSGRECKCTVPSSAPVSSVEAAEADHAETTTLRRDGVITPQTQQRQGARFQVVRLAPTPSPLAQASGRIAGVQNQFPSHFRPMHREDEGDGLVMGHEEHPHGIIYEPVAAVVHLIDGVASRWQKISRWRRTIASINAGVKGTDHGGSAKPTRESARFAWAVSAALWRLVTRGDPVSAAEAMCRVISG